MKLYNTPHKTLEEFEPLNSKQVTMYTCGPTVYSDLHIGNWVSFIRWDTLVRLMNISGYTVNRVMNITDVGHLTSDADEGEDKMQKGARLEGITEWDVAKKYTESFIDGMKELNLLEPQHLVKATEHIDIQIQLIQQIEKNGHTYLLEDGLYFDTSTFPDYAKFAHLDLDAQKAGARVQYNTAKKNSSDFVLWRLTPRGETRAMEWDSPWGKGIPGWHIECSAMAMHYLGPTIDIHTGGIDHIPVHHTNEIAQSESATGKTFSRYWLHNAHLLSNGTKLSKSLGNSYTLQDLKKKGYSARALRMFVLQSHYRTESNFSWENLYSAQRRLERWEAIACLRWQLVGGDTIPSADTVQHVADSKVRVLAQLEDDMNTPEALVEAEKALDDLEQFYRNGSIATDTFIETIKWIDIVFGLELLQNTPDITDSQKSLIASRHEARTRNDWAESDRIRDQLNEQRLILNDVADKVFWYRSADLT